MNRRGRIDMANSITNSAGVQYRPWGFKLNLMYASIPPRYYCNIHNFNEFNAPRIDIGMLTAALYEQAIYGFNPDFLPKVADKFYRERREEIAGLVKKTLVDAGVVNSVDEMEFKDGMAFVQPTEEVEAGPHLPDKKYPLFVLYASKDAEGDTETAGIPFLRVLFAQIIQSEKSNKIYNWDYKEIRIGRGDEKYQYKPFIVPPMFIAYFPETYTNLNFDYYDSTALAVYNSHSHYFRVDEAFKKPYEDLINRETISQPNEYGEFVIYWDGVPASRSIVASQTYYDWDDDFQSAQVEAQLATRINTLEEVIMNLRNEIDELKGIVRK
jgi:hypothetical protein